MAIGGKCEVVGPSKDELLEAVFNDVEELLGDEVEAAGQSLETVL